MFRILGHVYTFFGETFVQMLARFQLFLLILVKEKVLQTTGGKERNTTQRFPFREASLWRGSPLTWDPQWKLANLRF